MKRNLKSIWKTATAALLCALLLTALPITALAAEGSENTYQAEYITAAEQAVDEISTQETSGNSTAMEEADDSAHITDEESVSREMPEGAENGEKDVFTAIYDEVMKNAGDIFSTLAFISSLLIAIAYKKGLLPALTKAVSGIEGAIDKVRKSADESREGANVKYSEMLEKLGALDERLALFSESVNGVNNRLGELECDTLDREKLNIIMSSQIDLLYDVFMSSSLPQYQKEAIGNRVVKMREELARNE